MCEMLLLLASVCVDWADEWCERLSEFYHICTACWPVVAPLKMEWNEGKENNFLSFFSPSRIFHN